MGKSKIAGPGRLGSIKAMKKSLKGGGQSQVRRVPKEDSLTVRFLENPEDWHGYYEHWLKDGPIPCSSSDCEGCQSDDEKERKRQFRYLANAYIVDDQKVRPLQMVKTLVEQLVNFHQKYGTLLDRDYELSRTGSGQNDTKYMAAPDAPSKVKLSRFEDQKFDLSEVLESMLEGEDPDDDDDDDDDDEDYTPKRRPKKSRGRDPWDDDDDDDDDDDEDDEPVRRPKKKSSSVKKKSASSKTAVKKSSSGVKRPAKKTVAKKRTVRR